MQTNKSVADDLEMHPASELLHRAETRRKIAILVLMAGVVTAAVAVWPSTITRIASSSFLPHGFCYLWNKQLLALHVLSDSLIFLSYLAISCTIAWLLYRERHKLPFTWLLVAFGTFIVACGFTHAMDVVVLWVPLYWLAGDIKFITAIASVTTACALPFLVPKMRGVLKESASAHQNELRFVGAAETSMDCLYLADAVRDANGEIQDFIFTYANDNAVALVTYSREELIGSRMCELFPINRKVGLLDRYKDVVFTGKSFVDEFAISEDKIKTSWLRIQAGKLGDGVAVTASDVTERKRQEQRLRTSRNFLQRTEKIAGIGGWELDLVTGCLVWSAETCRIMGVNLDYQPTLENAIGFYIPEDRPVISAAVERASAQGSGFDLELTITRMDGKRVSVRVVGSAELSDGKPVRLTGAFQDVSGAVEVREALRAANELQLKLKDEFLSHVSHELRSPLTSIYSFSSIIADDLAGETTPRQQEYLRIVLKNVVQLQSMIEDLLTVTQSREGKLSVDAQAVSIGEAVVDAMNTIQGAADSKKISISAADFAGLPSAWADPTRLRQVLIILLDNALKFTPAGGRIRVEASEKELGLLLIQVSDTGCGVPKDKWARIFDKLYQVTTDDHSDTSRAGRTGLGLGLHIARNLVTRQGGNIWVTSTPGHGSVFHFTLPISSEWSAATPLLV